MSRVRKNREAIRIVQKVVDIYCTLFGTQIHVAYPRVSNILLASSYNSLESVSILLAIIVLSFPILGIRKSSLSLCTNFSSSSSSIVSLRGDFFVGIVRHCIIMKLVEL